MAKFCVYCGKPLQEGEVCSCRAQNDQQTVPTTGETPQASQDQQIPRVPQAAPNPTAVAAQAYLKQLWLLIVNIFKAPVSAAKSFAGSGDFRAAWGLVVIRALSFALFLTALCLRISAAVLDGLRSFSSSLLGSTQAQSVLKFPLAKVFFLALITSFGIACLFAAILLLFNKVLFKTETDYLHMLCVSGVNSMAGAPFLLAGMLLLFLNVNLGICVALLGLILQPIFTVFALEGTSQIDRNKSVYTAFFSIAILMVCVCVVARLTYSMYLPDDLKAVINQVKSGSDLLGSYIGKSGLGSNLFG